MNDDMLVLQILRKVKARIKTLEPFIEDYNEEELNRLKLDKYPGVIVLNEIDKYYQMFVLGIPEKVWFDKETKEIVKDKSLINLLNMTCVLEG